MDEINFGTLLTLPLFAALADDAKNRLRAHAFVQSQPSGAILFEQGDTPQFLHVILSGRVALVGSAPAIDDSSANPMRHPPEREAIIEMFGAGDVVIAPAVLLDLPYLMAARIIAPSRIALIPAALIRDFFDKEVEFSKAIALILAKHWRLLSRQLKDQKLRSGTQRLGSYLLSISDDQVDGPAEFEVPVDRRTLASWLGMSAENLSRSLAQLKTMGVHVNGRRARIDDIVQIRSFCLEDDLR